MADYKTPEELKLANMRFAITEAVKLGYVEGMPTPASAAQEFFGLLDSMPDMPEPSTGFRIE